MTTLYIIGNGFDLWHGLPTGYGSFYEHAEDALNELEAYYVNASSPEQPWHDFENCLGTFDCKKFYDDHNNADPKSESFKSSDMHGVEDELNEEAEKLVEKIRELFEEWISDIDVASAAPKFTFDLNSQFLSFNYTETLQEVYKIPSNKVLHIHGSVDAHEELKFGHGETMKEAPEQDENGDSNRTPFTDSENAAKYPFHALQKQVHKIIEKNAAYFSSLTGVTKIVIIGHSLNKIDLPYFMEIAKFAPNCEWHIHYFSESDNEKYRNQIIDCGVDTCRIQTCPFPQAIRAS